MRKQVLFIQGAAEGAHDADATLVASLRRELGPDYDISFPALPNEAGAGFEDWRSYIQTQLDEAQEPVILVAHSVGASALLKYLSETGAQKHIVGLFLLAAPFWGGDGWLYEGYEKLELPKNLASTLPQHAPVFLYHCKDDETVPYDHLALYTALLPHATGRPQEQGGHMFNDDMSLVAQDIKGVAPR